MATTLVHRASAADLDRTKIPSPKPAPEIHLPDIQKAKLANGLQVWLVEMHKLPTVAFNLVLQSGSERDPVTMPGLASMTAALLNEGTQTRDAMKVSNDLEAIGASVNVGASADGTSATLSVLSKNLDKGLEIYTDILTHPAFAQKDFERLRDQRVTGLIQQRDRPPMIASNAFNYVLYTASHPYGNNASGTEESLGKMTVADIQKFYSDNYRPNNGTLIVVGDVTMSQIKDKLDGMLSGWTSKDVASFTVPAPPQVDQTRVYLVDKPGAPQSEVRIGDPAVARNTPDFFPLLVMNRVLGGQFTSRLNLNIRERHGYTYGVSTRFTYQKGVGPFVAGGGIVSAKTDSALIEFVKEIDSMQQHGLTADELDFSKKGTVGGFALSFETPAQIAGALQNIVLYGLPDDYYRTYLQNIDKVSLDDVNRVASKYLKMKNMVVLVVGDLASIRPGIEKLNLGPITVLDVDGKPIK
jgi:zinc protease